MYAAISGRLSKAFRFRLVCCADGLELTCWCVPITYGCVALGERPAARTRDSALIFFR